MTFAHELQQDASSADIIVVCSWRANTDDCGHDGEEAHRRCEGVLDLRSIFEFLDDDLLLPRRRGERMSVAQGEDLR